MTQPSTDEDRTCPLDGILIREHEKCSVCSILIGPRHVAKEAIEWRGRVLCGDCAKRKKGTR